MSSSEAHLDIITYILDVLDERTKDRSLVIGNIDLLREIKEALVQGANEMLENHVLYFNHFCLRRQVSLGWFSSSGCVLSGM